MAQSTNIDQKFIFKNVKRTTRTVIYGDYGEMRVELEKFGARYTTTKIYARVLRNMKQKKLEDALERECCRNSQLCHPNVLQFLGFYYDPDEFSDDTAPLLVTEMVQASISSLMEIRHVTFANAPLHVKLSILLGVSSGLWYLHSQNPPIIHGEISPSSIFLTEELVAKIGNLGLASAIQPGEADKDLMVHGYAKAFVAPEAVQETGLECNNPGVDVFAFGGLILYLVNQEWPEPLHDKVVKHRFRKNEILSEIERRQKHLDKMTGYSAVLRPLIEACLQDDPNERAKIKDIYSRLRKLHEPYCNVSNISWRLQSGVSTAVSTDKESQLIDILKTTQIHLDQQEKLIASLKVCDYTYSS